MKDALEIYFRYQIMPALQRHQLRVAGVARQICDSVSHELDTDGVVSVCLLHDMGNIIKFDLSYFPEFVKPEGLEHWQKVKDGFVEKYGSDEHVATEKICREIGLSETEMGYLSAVGFSRASENVTSDSLERKICCYSDMRVGPHGVLSIEERLADGRKRYAGKKHTIASERFEEMAAAVRELERQIFLAASIRPEDVTDASVDKIVASLEANKS